MRGPLFSFLFDGTVKEVAFVRRKTMVAVHIHGQPTVAGIERRAVVPWLFATPSQLSTGISWSDSSEHRPAPVFLSDPRASG